MAGLEAVGLDLPDPGSNDIVIRAEFKNVQLGSTVSNQLVLYAGVANGDSVRAGLHRSAGALGYMLNGNVNNADDAAWGTGASPPDLLSNGDDIVLTLSRTGGLWSLSWDNLTDPLADGSSPGFSYPWLDNTDLFVGIHYGTPRTSTAVTS
jgi:hypothetical protein